MLVEELVPAPYHHLRIFQKYALQGLLPRCWYNFRIQLTLGAVPQASCIILLSPAENE
ncbi:uncharacterized protein VP01_8564g1, partial [Puccinia sorghi]